MEVSGQLLSCFTPWGRSLWYSLNTRTRLGEPHSWSGCWEEENNIFPLPGMKPRFLNRPAYILLAVLPGLPRLLSVISSSELLSFCVWQMLRMSFPTGGQQLWVLQHIGYWEMTHK
jgi:hypothetical protein